MTPNPDSYITNSRYSKTPTIFTCQECGAEFDGCIISEYGIVECQPEECIECGSGDIKE